MSSFFPSYLKDFENKEAYKYYKKQCQIHALKYSKYMQAMIGLALYRLNDMETPKKISSSLNEYALRSEEMGMYWKETAGYYWHEAPIERQAMMIEFFHEAMKDKNAVDEMNIWLLKQKQTTHWKTTKATTEAIYALLLRGTNFLSFSPEISIQIGKEMIDTKTISSKSEAGTGYFKKKYEAAQIIPEMATINIDKKGDGVSWGAAYWQYFEQLDKIKPNPQNPFKLTKKLFIKVNTPSGPVLTPITEKNEIKPGDLITVRLEIKSDRNLEYVHLKDMRAAGFEPINVLSTHKNQDGLSYYESTRDAATHFFIGYLSLGSYVFEYDLRAQQSGNFSNGITSIECMYAPEFGTHSEGIRVNIIGK
jgi:hypothetical protein